MLDTSGFFTANPEGAEQMRRFLANVKEARDNGYDLLCAQCGCGIYDDSDFHDTLCTAQDEA